MHITVPMAIANSILGRTSRSIAAPMYTGTMMRSILRSPEDAKPTPTMAKDAHTQASLISSVPEVIK